MTHEGLPLHYVWGFNTGGLVFSYRVGTDIVISQKRGERKRHPNRYNRLKRPDSDFNLYRQQLSDKSGPW